MPVVCVYSRTKNASVGGLRERSLHNVPKFLSK